MPAGLAIGALVASWGAGTVVTAIAIGAVNGMIAGAVIGAATSLMTGGDILEGTLKGALVGGITGGVLNGVAEGVFGAGMGGVDEAMKAGEALSGGGASSLGEAVQMGKDAVAANMTTGLPTPGGAPGGTPGVTIGSEEFNNMDSFGRSQILNNQTAERIAAMNNEQLLKTTAVAAGGGLLSAGGEVLAGNAKAKADEALAEKASEEKKNAIAGNVAYAPATRSSSFTPPKTWGDTRLPEQWAALINSLNPSAAYQGKIAGAGLLQGGAA